MLAFDKQQGNLLALGLLALALSLLAQQASALDPVVKTGVSELSPDGRHVEVHLPGVFNMVLDTRGKSTQDGYRLVQQVLSGLVDLNIDRARDATGRKYGPIRVKVLGLTWYDNHAEAISATPNLRQLAAEATAAAL